MVSLKRENILQCEGEYYITYQAEKTGKDGKALISATLARRLMRRCRKGFLFPSYGKTGHITRQAVWYRMKRACERAGIEPDGISPHSLRKNFAVALRHEQGIEAVKNALQHSNLAVTRVYAYADTVLQSCSDEPIRWCDLELLVDYILERLKEST